MNFNITTMLIDFAAWLGLAYDCKKPSANMIAARKGKSGDGTETRVVRRQKLNDWVVGILVTTSQLIISLSLRFVFLNCKRYFYGRPSL